MDITDGQPQPLGSTFDGGGTNFAVCSSVAQRVDVCLFDEDGRESSFALPGRTGDVWHGYISGVAPGQRYGFRVHGPWAPHDGHLCSPEKLLIDPYGKAVDGEPHWDDTLFPYDPEHPSAPANRGDSSPFVPKTVVVDSQFDWRGDAPPNTPLEDTIIYELHVKGFTIEHPRVPSEIRGTYAGLAHPAAIEHLTSLGVTAVELLPVFQFVHRRRLTDMGLRNYWGYDPLCFFSPHNGYAHDRSSGGVVDEFKRMVRALHAAGLEVIIDVVYNHTGEGGASGPVLGLKGLDNGAYYRLQTGDVLEYVDVTGTKNTLNTEYAAVRRLIVDSLRYWVTEMHVDGFRFDLAPVLARTEGGFDYSGGLLDAIRRVPALKRCKLIAEPWDISEDGYQLGRFPTGWSEWNDRFRDDVRDFWIGRTDNAGGFVRRFSASPDIFAPSGRPPQASLNFVTCHDGYTLRDLVSYETKHNEANGEENRDGHGDNHSWNCGVEGPTDDPDINELRLRQKRNFIATLMLSQGVPMFLGGDELGRTQRGNNNAYCQDNEMSWFDWGSHDPDLRAFVASLIAVRKRHAVFRSRVWRRLPGEESPLEDTAFWFDARGEQIQEQYGASHGPLQVVFAREDESAEPELLIAFNPTDADTAVTIPNSHAGKSWRKIVDTSLSTPLDTPDVARVTGVLTLTSRSLVVLARL